ncbi:unnamed protein product [Eruca vesicaria subsp. sativa]|uniref:14-3-3 domain-containing protein n=1 Tax=Eruca vesicaria subsp. sativa TaxID=29727 RepID=A0ABC8J1I3_ERUVS|nr:unnamed protein product [Eruca vesicaria subsp. sativa]
MMKSMRKACEHDIELSDRERELLAIGYKKVMTTKRASLRTFFSIEEKEDSKGNKQNVNLINKKIEMVKDEFFNVCNDILSLIDSHLIPSTNNVESTVYYYTMKANYFRYMAEFGSDAEREGAANNSVDAYRIAMEMAESGLSPTNLVRLGLALNFSIFSYEILKSTESACKLAKKAYDNAISELDGVDKRSYEDAMFIVEILRGNLSVWTGGNDILRDNRVFFIA